VASSSCFAHPLVYDVQSFRNREAHQLYWFVRLSFDALEGFLSKYRPARDLALGVPDAGGFLAALPAVGAVAIPAALGAAHAPAAVIGATDEDEGGHFRTATR